ncbi:MAG: hypothetical protein Kow0074_04530 [Candidatus Zixiibacteriota bacterium]
MNMKALRVAIFVLALVATGLTLGIETPRSADDPAPGTKNAALQSAERLVIQYKDGEFTILSRTTVQKVLPPSTSLPAGKGQVRGTWFEVQDVTGAVVYRRPMTSPRVLHSETLNESSGQIEHAETEVTEQVFSVLVPAQSEAKSLVLFDSPTDPNKRTAAASEIARLALR